MFTFDISNFSFYIPILKFEIPYRNSPKQNTRSLSHNIAIAEVVYTISAT